VSLSWHVSTAVKSKLVIMSSASVKSKLVIMSSAFPWAGCFSVAASLILASLELLDHGHSFRSLSVEMRDVHVHVPFVL
jgi:hypothetical protein